LFQLAARHQPVENVATAHAHLRHAPRDYSPALLWHVKALTIPADTLRHRPEGASSHLRRVRRRLRSRRCLVAPTVGMAAETVQEYQQGYALVDGRKVALAEERGNLGTLCTTFQC
jgi:hypothetical protein